MAMPRPSLGWNPYSLVNRFVLTFLVLKDTVLPSGQNKIQARCAGLIPVGELGFNCAVDYQIADAAHQSAVIRFARGSPCHSLQFAGAA